MNMALDIGSHHIRSLRREDSELIARSQRCVYAVLPDSAANRRLLGQANLDVLPCDDALLLLGDDAWEHASLFHVQTRCLFQNGLAPANDPVGRQLIAALVEAVLPRASRAGSVCTLALPVGLDLATDAVHSSLEFFARLVRLQGYEPLVVPSGTALILAELVDDSFTGIGLVCGASGCELVLAHRGSVVCRCGVPLGGNWLDSQLAEHLRLASWDVNGERFLDTVAACRVREAGNAAPSPDASTFGSPDGGLRARKSGNGAAASRSATVSAADLAPWLEARLTDVLHETLAAFASEFSRTRKAVDLPQPFAVVVGGGLSQSPQFRTALSRALCDAALPVAMHPPQYAAGWPYTICRGLLIAAELESSAGSSQTRRAA